MELYMLRHAWAGHFGDPKWPDDSKRPLSEKGKRRFAEMACILTERTVEPTLIATSPMVRCRQTADILAEQLAHKVEIVERPELLAEGTLESLLAWTNQQIPHHDQIAWVGHHPHINAYTASLIGLSNGSLHFSKGAAALIHFNETLALGQGELRWLVTAKMFGI